MSKGQGSRSKIDCVLRVQAIVGESPIWSSHDKVLYWVDIAGQDIHRFHPASGVNDTFHLPQLVTSVALRQRGGLIITVENAFAFFDPDTGQLTLLDNPEPGKHENRFNDGKCDRQGRFWAGTMNHVRWDAPSGSLYRCDPDLRITRVRSHCICSNGLGWSPDDRVMYHSESFCHNIYAFDFDASVGTLSNQRLFASVDKNSGGFPDGLTVDAEGCVWSAQPVLGRLVRYSPAGHVDSIIEFPVPRPTSCTFGGDNLDVLYVTSARETMTAEQLAQAPLSGSLFAVLRDMRILQVGVGFGLGSHLIN